MSLKESHPTSEECIIIKNNILFASPKHKLIIQYLISLKTFDTFCQNEFPIRK
jgi:hypothetical protein